MTSDVKAALLSSEDVFRALMAQQSDDLAPRNVNQHHVLFRCINYTAGLPQESHGIRISWSNLSLVNIPSISAEKAT